MEEGVQPWGGERGKLKKKAGSQDDEKGGGRERGQRKE